ncbi:MAG: HEAT repeat domain-containing protein [Hyphomicrobiales bacterium]|nr:HEAT repeat domain-containing protein [Hyphomicrobiales bacterium]
MLWVFWSISILLSALSLAVMCALIARRLFRQRRARADADARQRLFKALIAFSQDRSRETLKSVLLSVPTPIALDAGFEFLSLLRGEEHDGVIAVFVDRGLADHVERQLRKGNAAERIHAVEMLAAFSSGNAAPALLSALDCDRSREVRIAAAISLCDLGALPPLEIVLPKIGIAGQRSRRLIELFRRIPADRIGELKAYAVRSDVPAFVRAAAIDALARMGDFRLADLFVAAMRDDSPEVAAAALRALGRTGHPRASAILAAAMESDDWGVRSEAANAAGRLGLADLVTPLAGLLDDEAWTVRYAAAKAMRAIAPHGEGLLREIASSQTSRSQRTASLILSEGPAS